MDKQVEEILTLLKKCSADQRRLIFAELRKEFKIHVLEERLNTMAEIILEAINKDENGLTFRMMRGVIAEAAFEIEVLSRLKNWANVTPKGDLPFDYLLQDSVGKISVQIKLQRSVNSKPMTAKQANKKFNEKFFVVETQKTRGGKGLLGESTRPYRFKEFDILGVSMQPSTGNWKDFMYTVSDWLIPEDSDPTKMLKFQPVSPDPNHDWTDDFEKVVMWCREGVKNVISQ